MGWVILSREWRCVTGRERDRSARLETDTGDIGGMGKSLQELGGLLLISDAGGFWGTEWDDQPIRPENFREWKKKRNGISEGNGENRNGNIRRRRRKKAESGKKRKKKIKKMEPCQKCRKIKGVRQDHDGGGDSGGCIKDIGNRKFISGSRSASAGATATRSAITASAGTTTARPAVSTSAETTATGAISSTSGNTLYDPFNDGYFTDCRKIRPSDCSALCRKNGCFCSNRFVMYGYQNFGHLLLCRIPGDSTYVGVPWIQQQDGYGNMFAFLL